MANPEHLEILKQGVEVWNRWREENPGVRPDLSDADLREANLHEAELSGAKLRGANLSGAYLSGAYLSGANLRVAELREANLREANLREAYLRGADLRGANLGLADLRVADLRMAILREANLREADLRGADLRGANLGLADLRVAILREANLRGADLGAADLRGADLSEAELNGAFFWGTGFGSTTLSKCKGLEDVTHGGESHLDPGTVLLSEGLPEAFLRGCGWPERLIVYWSSIAEQGIQFYTCFISYSHQDKSFAQRLHDQLQSRGIRCWLDEHELPPGDDLKDMIDHGIRLWDKVLLCCSEASLTSWWVNQEIEKALQKEERLWRERKKKTLAIIPLNLDGYLFDGWESGHQSMITSRLAADFVGWETDNAKFEEQFEKVVRALSTDELVRGIPPESKL